MDLKPDFAEQVLAACQSGAEEAAGALGRALGGEFTLAVAKAAPFTVNALAGGGDSAALVVLLQAGDTGFVVALPRASGLIPEWCAAPDASGESRLATLAQELSMLLLPPSVETTQFKAQLVDNLSAALQRAKPAATATSIPLDVKCGDKAGQLSFIWPLESPADLFAAPVAVPKAAPPPNAKVKAAKPVTAPTPRDLSALPGYSRSLLKISVPVSVQLAAKKESVQEVVSLSPGSIIKFDKGCEELLQMIVGEHTVAEGEAVKIGEKFGFRVTSMKLPPEHFAPVKKRRTG